MRWGGGAIAGAIDGAIAPNAPNWGYGPGYSIYSGARNYRHLRREI